MYFSTTERKDAGTNLISLTLPYMYFLFFSFFFLEGRQWRIILGWIWAYPVSASLVKAGDASWLSDVPSSFCSWWGWRGWCRGEKKTLTRSCNINEALRRRTCKANWPLHVDQNHILIKNFDFTKICEGLCLLFLSSSQKRGDYFCVWT